MITFAVYRSSSQLLRCTFKPSKMLSLEPSSHCINSSQISSLHNYLFSQEKISSNDYCISSIRKFHTSSVNKDMESAVKAVGAGISAIGCGTAGIGIGISMGNLCQAAARNPSLKNQLFTYGLMGAVFSETMGLVAFVLGILCLYG